MIQFLYGEDGMAGEHIEDMTIQLLKLDNHAADKKYKFMPSRMKTSELEDMLK